MAVDARPGSARRRTGRHLRTVVTLLILIGFVVGAALYGWRALTADAEDDATANPECVPAAPVGGPAPAEIQVNVYNATSRSGLASATAGQLRDRTFVILAVANDPLARAIPGTAEVRANVAQQPAADVLIAQVPGAVFVPDERVEPTVDLVLGDAFEGLGPAPAPAAAAPPPEGEVPADPAAPEAPAEGADPAPTVPTC